MNQPGELYDYIRRTELEAEMARLRQTLKIRANDRIDLAIERLQRENAELYKWNTELRAMVRTETPVTTGPLVWDDMDTRGT